MSIGDNYFTEVKHWEPHTSAFTANLDWNDEDIHIFSGTDDVEVNLPRPHVSNTWGELWIVNKNINSGASVTLYNRPTRGGDTVDRLVLGNDIAIPQHRVVALKYVPQRTFNTIDGEVTSPGGWLAINSTRG